MLAVQYLVMLALWLAGARREHEAPRPVQAKTRAPLAPLALAGIAAAALFVVQLVVIDLAAREQQPFPDWFARLPLLPIDDRAPLFAHTAPWVSDSALLLALAQSAVLFVLLRLLRGNRLPPGGWVVLASCCLSMLGAALLSRGLTSSDLYAYVGSARLAGEAYAPPSARFGGGFGVVNELEGVPILPAAYGPLWLALARAATSAGTSLAGQLEALRFLGAALFVVSIPLLRAARFDAATIALFALNPALVGEFVANGHNDIAPFALTLAAFAAAPRRPYAAVACAAAAGAMKLPFLAIAPLAFAATAEVRPRLLYAAATVGLALLSSVLFGGQAYFEALHRTSQLYPPPQHVPTVFLYIASAAAALSATALALWRRRFIPTASWSFSSLATALFPWYLIWGLPYALAERRCAGIFLASLPLAALLLSRVYAPTVPYYLLTIAILCIPFIMLLRSARGVAVPS
jgi:hypothetical protein